MAKRANGFALLTLVCLLGAPGLGGAVAGDAGAGDEQVLRENKVATDGPALLDFVRKSFVERITEKQLAALVEQLGDDSFDRREEATFRLVRLGVRAKARLVGAAAHDDPEVRVRARVCLEEIGRNGSLPLLVRAAAVRVLARRKVPGALPVLFSSLPHMDDETVCEEARQAIVALARAEGKTPAVVVAGLTDNSSVKRASAAVILCRLGAAETVGAVKKLLGDADPRVRLAAAVALVQVRHKEAVPVLLALMEEPPSRETGLVEDMLFHLAGERSPALAGPDLAARKAYRKAWEAWWAEHGGKIDLAVLQDRARHLGHTTVVLLDKNAVVDLDASNRQRWKIEAEMVLDIQRLPGEKVLLAEYKGNRVTERNSKGEVVWKYHISEPLVAQRLANGHTFIANKEGVFEIDRKGKEVFSYTRPNGEQIMRARKLPGGDILLVAQLGVARFVRLNRFGKEIRNFAVEVSTSGGRVDLTPAGNVLIPEMNNHRVLVMDMTGKVVREISVPQPVAAASLPNGHVVVTSMSQNRAVEFDRGGKEVWEYKRDTRVTRAIRH
jgi:hypothetical protein